MKLIKKSDVLKELASLEVCIHPQHAVLVIKGTSHVSPENLNFEICNLKHTRIPHEIIIKKKGNNFNFVQTYGFLIPRSVLSRLPMEIHVSSEKHRYPAILKSVFKNMQCDNTFKWKKEGHK